MGRTTQKDDMVLLLSPASASVECRYPREARDQGVDRVKGAGSSGFRVVESDTHMDYGYAKRVGARLDDGEQSVADEIKLNLVVKSTGSETGGLRI